MTAATMCSYISVLWSGPDLERCVKARRSPTRSWRTAARASRRPTICAPRTKRFPCKANAWEILPEPEIKKAALATRPFSACLNAAAKRGVFARRPVRALLHQNRSALLRRARIGVGGREIVIHDAGRLTRPRIGDIAQIHARRRHH